MFHKKLMSAAAGVGMALSLLAVPAAPAAASSTAPAQSKTIACSKPKNKRIYLYVQRSGNRTVLGYANPCADRFTAGFYLKNLKGKVTKRCVAVLPKRSGKVTITGRYRPHRIATRC